jgi:hypothetical protein
VPVTIDATAGGAASNSYATVAEADAYLEARLNSAAWTGDEPKKQALVEAARELTALGYVGYRTSETQALAWPRFNAPDPDGTSDYAYYDTTEIPRRIKDAQCELALEFLRAGTSDIAGTDTNAGVIQKVVDVLSTTWQPGQRPQGLARFPRVQRLLEPLLAIGTGQVRLTR